MRVTSAVAVVAFVLSLQAGGAWGQKTSGKPEPKKEPVSEYMGKPVEFWIKEIKNRDQAKAEYAINAILYFTPAKAALALPELMDVAIHKPFHADDAGVRLTAAEAIGIILSRAESPKSDLVMQAVGILRTALKDQQYAVRMKALESLAALGPRATAATPDFMALADEKILGAGSWQVRAKAITLLPQVAFVPKVGVKLEVLKELYGIAQKDSCSQVRLAGIHTLLSFVNPKEPLNKTAFVTNMTPIAVKDPDPLVQIQANLAIMVVMQDVPKQNLAIILNLMQHDEPSVRVQAIGAAGKIAAKAPSVVPALLKSLTDTDLSVRVAAINSLGVAGPLSKEAVPVLERLLSDKELAIRLEAVVALGSIGVASVVPSLIEKLSDSELNIQFAAMQSLSKLRDKRAVGPLIKKMSDKNPAVQSASIRALGLIGKNAEEAIQPLLSKLGEKDLDIRAFTIQALGRMQAAEAVGPLVKELDDEHVNIVKFSMVALATIGPGAKDAVLPLTRKLADKDQETVVIAIGALGKIGPNAAAAVPELQKLADDITRPQFRPNALRAIELITMPAKSK